MWNRFADKTEQQVAQELSTIKANGSPEERQAAAEIIDEVGQRMGLVRSEQKSAVESASKLMETPGQPPRSAAEADLMGGVTLPGAGGARIGGPTVAIAVRGSGVGLARAIEVDAEAPYISRRRGVRP